MSVTRPRSEYEELVYIADRLAHRFPAVSEDEIIGLLADELADYDHARLRAYVPVLIEGRVTRRLRALR
ncbi:three-helix bundle dimerization domain-containing protein [Microbacterium koreense]|uniref:Three-helix bundle dimerization domain-containing protein n=1 Tax=Microbacterium koreense TaxID=323761 RepID=A0ABW2ZPD8_9MICO